MEITAERLKISFIAVCYAKICQARIVAVDLICQLRFVTLDLSTFKS